MLRCFFIFFLASAAFSETCDRPVVGAPVVPPLIVVDANGQLTGPVIEKALKILKPLFPDLTFARPAPQNRVVNELKSGQIDIQLFELFNDDRKEIATYSKPIGSVNWVITTRSNLPFTFTGLESLNNLRGGYLVAAPLPDRYKDYLENHPKTEALSQPSSILNMFQLDRIDYILALENPINFHIKNHPTFALEDFTNHKESYVSGPIHLTISNRSPCLDKLDAINQSIERFNEAADSK